MNGGREGAKMYFMAVVLPKHLDEKVLQYKRWMHENYGSKVGLKSPAHITIVPPFWLEEEKEEDLKRDMNAIARKISSFQLSTANFSAFKPRTIFVAVAESSGLKQLKKEADLFFRQSAYKIKVENRAFHPHITIATRDLHKNDFAEAWPHFQDREFLEAFDATGLSLLKHNGRTWDVVYAAEFTASSPAGPAGQP